MRVLRNLLWVSAIAISLVLSASAEERAIRIPLPKRSKVTPVQKLNRDGVKAIEKRDYEKAKRLFYQAYLIDPEDPFTLNNLGYLAEIEGEIERAQRYYSLASEHKSEAMVDVSNNPSIEGMPVNKVAGNTEDSRMKINRLNVEALTLLNRDRASEADLTLQEALKLDRNNPFSLNNMGFAKEKQGEYESALSFYTASASQNSQDAIVIAADPAWRGKSISEVASDNAKKLRRLMRRADTVDARVARLNLRGVSALNRNDRGTARKYFLEANKLNPEDAFTLNNMGYLAEMDGDRETAEFYYAKAREAENNNRKVAVATRRDYEGMQLNRVAEISNQKVEARMQADIAARRRSGRSAQLRTRDGSVVPVPEVATPAPNSGISFGPSEAVPPVQDTTQPRQPSSQQPTTPAEPAAVEPTTQQPQQQQRTGPVYDIPTPDDPGAVPK